MSDSSESILKAGQADDGSEVPERLLKDDAGNVESRPAEEEQPQRHSERTRTLTEKGKAMQEEKIKTLKQRFNYSYNKWRTHVKLTLSIYHYHRLQRRFQSVYCKISFVMSRSFQETFTVSMKTCAESQLQTKTHEEE